MINDYKYALRDKLNDLGLFWEIVVTTHFVERLIERNIDVIDAARLCRHALINHHLDMICNKDFSFDYANRIRIVGKFEDNKYKFITAFKPVNATPKKFHKTFY